MEGDRLHGQVGQDAGAPGRPGSGPFQKGGACDLFVFVFLGPLGITGAQEVFIEQIKTENTLTRETEFNRTWGSDQRNNTAPEATTRAISTFSWQPGSAATIRLAQGQVCKKAWFVWLDLSW